MSKKILFFVITLFAGIALVLGIRAIIKRTSQSPNSNFQAMLSVPDQRATPADRQIKAAQAMIFRTPGAVKGYNLLAAAYMQKARETGDFGFNARAEATLERSFTVAPDNLDALRLKAYLLLSYHRFAEARDIAQHIIDSNSTDYEAYGALTDANVELGKYDEAKVAIQAMMNLRPYTASYARASYLRSLYGDSRGAIEAMRLAAETASPDDPESIAWCYTHLGDELMTAGKRAEAEHEYDHALFSFPDYYVALAAKARARLAAGDTDAAIDFYKRSQERVPFPDTVIALGDLYTKLGRTDDAKKQYDLVEFIERTSATSGIYSRQLALFYADHETKLDDALNIARRERAARSDVFTCDALAWVLYKRGEINEAKTEIDEALRLGTRDPRMLYHAGMIYQKLDDHRSAAKYLKQALAMNPTFDILQADIAKQTLRTINA